MINSPRNLIRTLTISGIFLVVSFVCVILGDDPLAMVFFSLAAFLGFQTLFLAYISPDDCSSEDYSFPLVIHILNKAVCVGLIATHAPFDRGPWVSLLWLTILAVICRYLCRNIRDLISNHAKKTREVKLSQLTGAESYEVTQKMEKTLRVEIVKSKHQQKMEDGLMADLGSFLSDNDSPKDKK